MISCNFYETPMDQNNKDSGSQNSNQNNNLANEMKNTVAFYLNLLEEKDQEYSATDKEILQNSNKNSKRLKLTQEEKSPTKIQQPLNIAKYIQIPKTINFQKKIESQIEYNKAILMHIEENEKSQLINEMFRTLLLSFKQDFLNQQKLIQKCNLIKIQPETVMNFINQGDKHFYQDKYQLVKFLTINEELANDQNKSKYIFNRYVKNFFKKKKILFALKEEDFKIQEKLFRMAQHLYFATEKPELLLQK